jgi:hypothetical protein
VVHERPAVLAAAAGELLTQRIRIDRIGAARTPVVLIDGLSGAPAELVEQAAAVSAQFSVRSKFYPGIRAPAPLAYRNSLRALLREAIRMAFGWDGDIEVSESNFSLVTTLPANLLPFQRIPHFDGTDVNELAVLHYLSPPHQGGTSFYRHRSTGFEVITPDCVTRYVQAVNAEAQANGEFPAQYVNGDTPLFERIARYEAAVDRALIYRGSSLHSGDIPADFVPDTNPRSGRLTVNSFLRPAGRSAGQ